MRFAVDSWDPDYGTSTRDAQLREASRPVDVGVEVPVADWRPIDPDGADAPETVTFVDGVRRIDARIWIEQEGDELSVAGVCATVAAGAVRCRPGTATIEQPLVRRALHTSASTAGPVELGPAGTYELREAPAGTDEALYLAVHNHMTELESELSTVLARAGVGGLIVFDGPLGTRDGANHAGYVKSQHVQYLDPELNRVVAELRAGQRTPLFHIGGELANWSWYLRLPGPRNHALGGIVRVELPGLGDADGAAHRADQISMVLPRYASEPHKDARAPQNLYPIAGLERELRRRLGDATLLDRALRRAAASTDSSSRRPIGA